ncbi:amidohydrolase family protein [Waltera intestinalis]|uniref:Amidohydrolase family protein n=1 Tax=Waltera intestinalis TaxID=2606635 RepID=A0A6L5YHA6_9FIRM|nr:amidohydrolase family protein [Waltera intestinalis]MST57042.1 amidohydrolase family protein [Waltera intestinalis]
MKYVFTNGKILNGTKDMQVQEGQVILVENERITEILPAEEGGKRNLKASGYEEIDLQGKYILPGLINMHVHLAGNGKPQKKQRDNEALVKKIMSNGLTKAIAYNMVCGFAKDELYSGVTTIRTVGGLGDFDTRLRDDIAAGKKPGPRILAANEGISVPGGHMAGSVAIAAGSIEEALQHLEIVKAQKVDLVKLMITGGVLDAKEKGVPGELKMAPEMVKAVCDKAHGMGYKVAAHVESPKGVKVALQNGVDSIEHGAKADEEMIALFKEHNAFLCTTLSPALPYALFDRSITNASEVEQFNGNVVFEGIIDCAKAAIANDIPVVLGNDVGCPWITQYDFWRELYYFHKYVGVSNTFALYTATCRGAEMAGIGDITGTLEPGKCADMIVVEKNPLEDIRALRNVDMVVSQGKVLRSPKVKKKQIVETELDKFL